LPDLAGQRLLLKPKDKVYVAQYVSCLIGVSMR